MSKPMCLLKPKGAPCGVMVANQLRKIETETEIETEIETTPPGVYEDQLFTRKERNPIKYWKGKEGNRGNMPR